MKINPEKLFNAVNSTNTFNKKDRSSKNDKYKKLLEVLSARKKMLSGAFKHSSLFGLFILILAPIIFFFTKKKVTKTVNTSELPTPARLSNFLNSIIREPIRMTSVYDSPRGGGRKHKGVDIRANVGTHVYAPFDGTVLSTKTSPNSLGGNEMIISVKGYQIGFSHLSEFKLKKGDKFKKGDLLAFSGATGRSESKQPYAPHLHISVKSQEKNWEYINPLSVDNEAFRDKQVSIKGVQLQNFGKERYNPYSIMGPTKWEGTVETPKRGAVVEFQDLFHSTRAAIKILNTYSKVGIKNINQFVDRFVTTNDGSDTARYKKQLSALTGFSPTESIDLTNKSTVSKILSGVARLESGSVVPEEYIEQVYDVIYNDNVNININNNNINNKKW